MAAQKQKKIVGLIFGFFECLLTDPIYSFADLQS